MPEMQAVIEENIRQFGWHAQCVFGDGTWPEFAYSIGWGINDDWPEVIVIGQRQEVAHGMLRRIRDADKRPDHDQTRTDILDGFACKFMRADVSWYPFLFGAAIDYYMDRSLPPFRAMQCVWPTTSGIFPWDQNAPQGFDQAQSLVNTNMKSEPSSYKLTYPISLWSF